eukprot:5886801-Alexandrium_andersonii.AAC.1
MDPCQPFPSAPNRGHDSSKSRRELGAHGKVSGLRPSALAACFQAEARTYMDPCQPFPTPPEARA